MRSRLATIMLGSLVCFGACTEDDAPPTSVADAAVTNIIPTSKKCDQGVGPLKCVQVSPITTKTIRWKVDGTKSPQEYVGATEIPYTLDTTKTGGGGTIFLQRVVDTTNASLPAHSLFVFFSDLTVPLTSSGTPMGKFHIYLDNARFDGATIWAEAGDQRIELDLDDPAATPKTQVVAGVGSTLSWANGANPAGLAFKASNAKCRVVGKKALCSGELKIPLTGTAVSAPLPIADGYQPGIGFFVRHVEVTGGSPEQLVVADYDNAVRKRTLWETLIFADPKGFPVKFLSWNLNRGTNGGGLELKTDKDVGEFIYRNDVIALQEVWRPEIADAILAAANAKRALISLPPYALIGPTHFDPAKHGMLTDLSSLVHVTDGGMYIMTSLKVVKQGDYIFSENDCQGMDCLRAKGVQYVRLALQDPSKPKTCPEGPNGCPKLPSGDDFVDVFNVSLQRDKPPICDDLAGWKISKLEMIDALPKLDWLFWGPIGPVIADILNTLIQDDLHCESSNHTPFLVRRRQFQRANEFISALAAKDRPSIILGGMHVNGKGVDGAVPPPSSPSFFDYWQMLADLDVSDSALIHSDFISIVADNVWDFDHGDIARERTSLFPSGTCTGTNIGASGSPLGIGCPSDLIGPDGATRTSYILLRPHAPLTEAKTKADPRWFAMKGGQPWSSPFPGATAAERMSDHRPVIGQITLVPLANPPPYHAKWKHTAEMVVTSVTTGGLSDCDTCGALDLKGRLELTEIRSPGPNTLQWYETNECEDTAQFVWPGPNNCGYYGYNPTMNPANTQLELRSEIWDVDTNPNDKLHFWTRLVYAFDDGVGKGKLRLLAQTWPTGDWTLQDNEPIHRCDSDLEQTAIDTNNASLLIWYKTSARVCYMIDPKEFPPEL